MLYDALAANPRFALLRQLTPRVGAGVIEGARVKRVLGDGSVDVVMAERHVIPCVRAELFERDLHRRAIELAPVVGQHAFDFAVEQQNIVPGGRIRL